MTPAEYTALAADPLNPTVWRIPELTPAQYAGIIAALANIQAPAHLDTSGSMPVATYLPADGGSVVAQSGTDSAGIISVTAGTGGAGGVPVVSLAFATAFTAQPAVVLTPLTLAAKTQEPWVTGDNTQFTINVTTFGAGTTFTWAYVVVGQPN